MPREALVPRMPDSRRSGPVSVPAFDSHSLPQAPAAALAVAALAMPVAPEEPVTRTYNVSNLDGWDDPTTMYPPRDN
jgi:hypothetical protein